MTLKVAVIGGGWAGLAAAVHATQCGHRVTLTEMAGHLGGRARSVPPHACPPAFDAEGISRGTAGVPSNAVFDNGQHILIGAYSATLALMRSTGVDPAQVLRREPLAFVYPDGSGLRLPAGATVPALVRGMLAWRGASWLDKMSLIMLAGSWAARRFACSAEATVAELIVDARPAVRHDLIEPLCVAALNTPAAQASARVFLRVVKDALLGPRGASDLLLPCAPLDALLPAPAELWLRAHGAEIRLGQRSRTLAYEADRWRVDGQAFDRVVLATTATEAARLVQPFAAGWADLAAALVYEPIVTYYLDAPGAVWPYPMMAFRSGRDAPAQFGFALGALGGPSHTFAFVVSGAKDWVGRGLDATADAIDIQLQAALGAGAWPATTRRHVRAEKRATFACRPGLLRPEQRIKPGLFAAGDYVAGPYPATLEGAVRSGRDAGALCDASL